MRGTRLAPPLLGLGLAFTLTACTEGGLSGLFGGTTQLAVRDGAVIVRGPQNFCIDDTASNSAGGFAVLAGCNVIAYRGQAPAHPALITVQVGEEGSATVTGAEEVMAEFLSSDDGVLLLSVAGDATTVDIEEVQHSDGLVEVRFSDTSAPVPDGLQTGEWRAFLDVADRLVTIRIRSLAHAPLLPQEGAVLLRQTVAQIQAANPVARPSENEPDAPEAPELATARASAG